MSESLLPSNLHDFFNKNQQQERNQGVFELESKHMLEVNLKGRVSIKAGSMVAYHGQIKFQREGMLDHGLGALLKKAVTGEGMQITYAEGDGKLYLADSGKTIHILKLNNESLTINGNDVLAFESSLQHKITMLRRIAGMMAGGLFNVRFDGTGLLAITSHHNPLTLRVTPGTPVYTDPNATIGWTSNLSPEIHTDISFRSLIGRGSGESIQLKFNGDGYVLVQPYEEVYFQQTKS